MRKLRTIVLGAMVMLLAAVLPVQTAEAAEGYTYNRATNTYTIKATKGNIYVKND